MSHTIKAALFGGAMFAHGTLTASMTGAPKAQAGLALGAWGAVQATAAGLAMAMSGVIRDLVNAAGFSGADAFGVEGAAGYITVYGIEIVLLFVTVLAALPLIRRAARRRGGEPTALKPSVEAPADADAA